ncbi:MAG: protein-L-isoaspartate(D-aspartate) O-methyltransferase [Lewinella sp.]|nr:protein-L-isoaspartate(D-aspartate) O-methyltransferase [Lewinella sp.]
MDELRRKGITDEEVLAAIDKLPRHFFMDIAFEEWAYADKPFPIGCEQTISQPFTVAFQTSLLEVSKRQKVLEIGTGSGYQAAVLALLGARVFTIERHETLYRRARQLLSELALGNVRCYHRDGYKGLPEMAPFDRILVTAGAETIPEALKLQMKIGGLLVIPVGKDVQRMLRLTRLSRTEWREEDFGNFRFVPFVEGVN